MDDTRQPPPKEQPQAGRGLWLPLAALGLTLVSALAGTSLAKRLRRPEAVPLAVNGVGAAEAKPPFPNRLFEGWKKPDLVLLVSGQQLGYLLPCGCSRPQYGGLERRYNLVQMFKEAGWPYAAVDLGDVVQRHGIAHLPNQQALIKYVYSMRALKAMGYAAVGVGEAEVTPGLMNVLAEYALNDQRPRHLVNLIDAEINFPGMTEAWKLAEPDGGGLRVGAVGVVGPTVATKVKEITRNDKAIRFEATPNALNRALTEMAPKVDLPVLLFQGPVSRNRGEKPYTEAMACAYEYPQFPIVVALSDSDDPPLRPYEVENKAGGKSLIVTLGKKGRHVGVFGVWKTGNPAKPFDLKYERVELGEEFLTPQPKEKGHPVIELIEGYTKKLKDDNYLQKYGQVRHELQVLPKVGGLKKEDEVKYAGTETCKRCHEHAYDVWKKSGHSHAYQTLVDAKRPSNRQYDPECIVCHTVGFGYQTGFVDEATTPKLKDVGCESCHGPSYVHVHNPNDPAWHKRINPWKYQPAAKKTQAIDDMCQKCHDIDNDVHWVNGGFKRKWPKVEHMTPPGEKVQD
ncbi:MAG: multiheme c-type cytochrome [Gemmataceae bacterium]